jgi:glc operon protein GlcG
MLKLAEANRAIVAAQAYARDHEYSISVTVCDSMGHLIAPQRMDDALLGSGHGSVGKAIASAGLGIPSGEESDVDLDRSSVSDVMAIGLPIIRRPGGLPIKRGGEVEGGIGVSGVPTNAQDEKCACRGIEAIGS